MFGPGAYRPDPTEGTTAIVDLRPPEIVPSSRNDKRQPCPRCGHSAYRDKQFQRTLHDLGNLDLWCPRDLVVTYSQHYCTKCQKYFQADLSDLAPPGSQYTHRVIDLAVRLVVEDGLPYRPASWHLWRDHRVFVPFGTIQNWVEAGGKKGSCTPTLRIIPVLPKPGKMPSSQHMWEGATPWYHTILSISSSCLHSSGSSLYCTSTDPSAQCWLPPRQLRSPSPSSPNATAPTCLNPSRG